MFEMKMVPFALHLHSDRCCDGRLEVNGTGELINTYAQEAMYHALLVVYVSALHDKLHI